jgi:hypothetical protein
MLNTFCTQVYIEILKNNKCNKNMIPPNIEIVSYTSIICMILIYDTLHYDQPYQFHFAKESVINSNQSRFLCPQRF